MSSNDHTAVKSIIQLLFCQLCGIDCSRSKKVHVVALAAVKPLDSGEPLELTTEGVKIWDPNWLGQVDDKLNAKFIEEVTEHVYNNKKVAVPSFNDVAAVQHKVALQCEQDSSHKGAVALIKTDLRSDVLTCNDSDISEDTLERRKLAEVGKSANKVIGHAWQSIDYVVFLCWLSFCTLKQQQDVNEPSSGSMRNADDKPQHKHRKTTKKFHKCIFDVSPEHLNHNLPQPKAMIFKSMVDETWHTKNLDMEVVEGVDWLKGFYLMLRQGEIFDTDATYLKELKEWLEAGMCTSSESEDDMVNI
ncbi:hypothetical protein BKA82DRAFT_30561 [Pisolithus tinctorius]|uniref:Uncharacterized protein n=1 Tax=Pisolithus tinctorius Marx 270 TaxID=870435 RepID=A0A0C3NE25_PISTI|nr:hypothetical protein BKA82DRAFT_30561 [Pisolithus tinctorius]KIN99329.1 hypothetical protein M404DRAFT_30561 [Pisolithus tinctorius Marx 270]